MFYYLYCKTPCAVKFNGEYLGIASKNLKYINAQSGFLELTPLDQAFNPFRLLLGENIANHCKNARIINLYGGFLIIPTFTKCFSGEFETIGKKTFSLSSPVTVFCYSQGGVKLVVSKGDDFLVESLPFIPEGVQFESCSTSGKEYLVVICTGKRSLILAYSVNGKITRAFKNLCDGYSFEKNRLTTVENKNDILRHTLSSTWEFSQSVALKSCAITSKRPLFSLPPRLIPYAFFEEVLLGGDLSSFLSPRLKPRADEVRSFLGDFKETLPPFHFMDEDAVTLLYENKVEYAKIEIVGGLIDNLTLL